MDLQVKSSPLLPLAPLLVLTLLAEIAYAALNISTMPVYLSSSGTGRGLGESAVGLVLVAFLLSEAVLKGPMGFLSDRFGYRLFIIVGPLLSVLTCIATLLVPRAPDALEIGLLMGLRAVDGLGAAMLWPAMFACVGNYVAEEHRQRAMAAINLCYLTGIAVALPLAGFLNDWTGFTWAGLILAGVFFFLASVLGFVFGPRKVTLSISSKPNPERISYRIILNKIPRYLAIGFLTFVGVGFPMATIKLFPQDQFGLSETMIGTLVLPAAAVMALLGMPISRFGEKLGPWRAVQLGLAFAFFGALIIAIGAFVPGFRSIWILGVGAIPISLGFLLTLPAWLAIVSSVGGEHKGAYLGAVMAAQGMGAIVGTLAGSFAYEKLPTVGVALNLGESFGRYSPFLGCATFLFAAMALSFMKAPSQFGGELRRDRS